MNIEPEELPVDLSYLDDFSLPNLTPSQIVARLDEHIVGQDKAKKIVAIALRDRYRRNKISNTNPIKNEIRPRNILMVGPTGVGKTEMARRLAEIDSAPFIKVDIVKFTEVGYVGRDVLSIIRDLVELEVARQRRFAKKVVKRKVEPAVIELLLDALMKKIGNESREELRSRLLNHELDNAEIEISVQDDGVLNNMMGNGIEMPGSAAVVGMLNLSDMFKYFGGSKTKVKKMTVRDAWKTMTDEESDKLTRDPRIVSYALKNVINNGIVFIDEIDKITSRSESAKGGEVSREGVQRDLLPLIEGTEVDTKYGLVRTDHILFIASGAFHMSKPEDLMPELQGRLPMKVMLDGLKREDMVRILTVPKYNFLEQFVTLMEQDGVHLKFTSDAISSIADYAVNLNENGDNIGARRLFMVLDTVLQDISFHECNMDNSVCIVDQDLVKKSLDNLISSDLKRSVL